MLRVRLMVIFTTFWMAKVSGQALFFHNETSLFTELFTNRKYDRNLFPRCQGMGSINVTVDMSLRQIVDLQEQSQLLTAMTWMRWTWTDCRLGWDPDHWGIHNLSLTAELLWVPDVTLYEGTGKPLHKRVEYPARLHSDGTVNYNFPAMIDATCKINMANFPFDRQKCRLTLASWVYTKSDLDLRPAGDTGDMDNYVNNGEWDLLSLSAERSETEYETKPDVFVEVFFHVVVNRRPIYYLFNIIFPTILIALVAILSFCLPPASGEKVSLSVTSLLTQTVFMLMLSQEMPTTSDTIPLLQQYFAVILCVVSVSTILTIFVLNLHYRGMHEQRVPPTVRRVFLNKYMARLFHPAISNQFENDSMNTTTISTQQKRELSYTNYAATTQLESDRASANSSHHLNGMKFTHVPIESISLNGKSDVSRTQAEFVSQSSPSHRKPESELLTNLADMLSRLNERSRSKDTAKLIAKEWGDLAIVLDRIFFIICLTGFALATLLLLAPHHIGEAES